jgi:hypothetical protein
MTTSCSDPSVSVATSFSAIAARLPCVGRLTSSTEIILYVAGECSNCPRRLCGLEGQRQSVTGFLGGL